MGLARGHYRCPAFVAKGIAFLVFCLAVDNVACETKRSENEACQADLNTGSCRNFIQKPSSRALIQKDHGVILTGEASQNDVPLEADDVDEPAVSAPLPLHCADSRLPQRAPLQAALPAVHHMKKRKSKPTQQSEFSQALDSLLAAVQYEAELLDIPMPMVMHRKVTRALPISNGREEGSLFWPTLLCILLVLVCLMLCCFVCCLEYKKPSRDKLIDHPPNLDPRPKEATTSATVTQAGEAVPTQDSSNTQHMETLWTQKVLGGSIDNRPTLEVRALAGATLSVGSANIFEVFYVDEATRGVVLQANVVINRGVNSYNQWYRQWQLDGLGNVISASPIGQVFGMTAREHPSISMFSRMQEDVGPCFLACRISEDGGGNKTYGFYDRDDKRFATLKQDPSSRDKTDYELYAPFMQCLNPKYYKSQNDPDFYIKVLIPQQEILVNSSRQELGDVAKMTPSMLGVYSMQENGNRITFNTTVDWQICCLVLEALMAVEMDRCDLQLASTGRGVVLMPRQGAQAY